MITIEEGFKEVAETESYVHVWRSDEGEMVSCASEEETQEMVGDSC